MNDELKQRIEQADSTLKKADEMRRLTEKVALLTDKNRQLGEELRETRVSRAWLHELVDEVKTAVAVAEPYPLVEFKRDQAGSSLAAVLKLSDWQTGEIVRAEETERFGKFDWQIEQDMVLGQLVPKFTNWVDVHRAGYKINTLHVFGENDWISGDIHDELRVTNEFPIPVQTAKAGWLLGEAVRRLAPHFEKVVVWELGADNHGRLVKKPQAKQKAQNNMTFLVYELANQYLAAHKNVELVRGEGMTLLAEVQKQKFLLEHGDRMKSWMGIPYYGMERMKGREAIRRQQFERMQKRLTEQTYDCGFDYMSMGHWHVPTKLGCILINGSLPGTSEFDHANGRFAGPAQTSFLVHRKHGLFDWTEWQFTSAL